MRNQTLLLVGGVAAAAGLYLYSRTQSGGAALASAVDYVSNLYRGARGIRDNNPGNIERSSIDWQGALSPDQVPLAPPDGLGIPYDPTFVQYAKPAYGVRAIGHVLRAKQARGLTNVDGVIRDYSATDQAAYVANVSQALGVGPFDTIDVYGRLPDLAAAIIQQENGQQPYDPADLAQWVYA